MIIESCYNDSETSVGEVLTVCSSFIYGRKGGFTFAFFVGHSSGHKLQS